MKFKQLLLLAVLLITSCLLSFSLFAQPTTVGMLAHFKLDGSATNLGPANITCTPVGTSFTTNNANVANKAIQFAGNVNSYVDFIDNGNLDFTGTTNFTISFSFFFNGTSNGGLIDNCLNYGGWGVWFWQQVTGTWNIQFNYKNSSVGSAAATAFTLNRWHHVAAVRNNGILSLYVDGVFRLSAAEGTMTPTYPLNTIAGAFSFSGYSPPRYNPLNGKMDEIRLYNRALSAVEIANLVGYSLPLKMGDFTATKKTSGIQLNWETITEQNTSHFEIEKSTDGNNFSNIGQVNAAGNSTDKLTYAFLDAAPGNRTNFYRLKMADIDGAFTYSRIIAVKNTNSVGIELFPNPVNDVLQVQLASDKKEIATVTITDATGKNIYSKQTTLNEGNNAMSIPVWQLSKGLYHISISTDSNRQTSQFIKQ